MACQLAPALWHPFSLVPDVEPADLVATIEASADHLTHIVTLAEELRSDAPPSVPEKYTEEASEFLQWLGEGNFTFLGYRTSSQWRHPDPRALVSPPGTRLGPPNQTSAKPSSSAAATTAHTSSGSPNGP